MFGLRTHQESMLLQETGTGRSTGTGTSGGSGTFDPNNVTTYRRSITSNPQKVAILAQMGINAFTAKEVDIAWALISAGIHDALDVNFLQAHGDIGNERAAALLDTTTGGTGTSLQHVSIGGKIYNFNPRTGEYTLAMDSAGNPLSSDSGASTALGWAQLSASERQHAETLAAQYMNMGLDSESARKQALATLISNRNNTAADVARTSADVAKQAAQFAANPRDAVAELFYRNQVGGSTPFGDLTNKYFGEYGKALAQKAQDIFQPVAADLNAARGYRDQSFPVDFTGASAPAQLAFDRAGASSTPPAAAAVSPAGGNADYIAAMQFLQKMQDPATARSFREYVTGRNSPQPLAHGGKVNFSGRGFPAGFVPPLFGSALPQPTAPARGATFLGRGLPAQYQLGGTRQRMPLNPPDSPEHGLPFSPMPNPEDPIDRYPLMPPIGPQRGSPLPWANPLLNFAGGGTVETQADKEAGLRALAGFENPEQVQQVLGQQAPDPMRAAIMQYGQTPLSRHAMALASHGLEGTLGGPAGDSGQAIGPYQIHTRAGQYPISAADANDPMRSTEYMSNDYNLAAERVMRENPGLWESDPARAAALTAFYAERPTNMYDESRYRSLYGSIGQYAKGGQIDFGGMFAGRAKEGYSPSSSEGGTNLNIHERAVIVGESGHVYGTLGEKRPDGSIRAEQLVIKPLKSEVEKDKKLEEGGKAIVETQKQTMKHFDTGGTANATPDDFMQQLSIWLGRAGGAGGGVGGYSTPLPSPRLLAGAPWEALQGDPRMLQYAQAGYSTGAGGALNPEDLDALMRKFTPEGRSTAGAYAPRVNFA